MAMRGYLLSSSVAVLFATIAAPLAAEPWARSYVVTDYEPAFHFGGSDSFMKAGILQPGADCPKGSNQYVDYNARLLTPWRNAKQVAMLLNPPNTDPGTVATLQERLLTYRGFRDGIDVYINPFAAPDPGQYQVTGKIAEGFDLDGNAKTGGFTSPDGERGIDNAFYRAWGCLSIFRDQPYHAILSRRIYDMMAVEGTYTVVIRVSGNKDPMNDDAATVEVGFSPDAPVVGGKGVMLADYSYRVVKGPEYSKVKATVKNGLVETAPVDELHLPRIAWFPNQYGDADLHQGRLRLQTDAQGNVSGLIGGYRDWREIFVEHNFTQIGGHAEQRDASDEMAMYYALKRNADGIPDAKTGQNTGISVAYRFKAQPAFVVDQTPSTRTTIVKPRDVADLIDQINMNRAAFYKALATRQIQPVPVGSDEGGYGRKSHIAQQPDGSWKMVPTVGEADRNLPTLPLEPKSVTPPPPKPQQQVLNGTPTVVASAGR